jgi:hypothetical protein
MIFQWDEVSFQGEGALEALLFRAGCRLPSRCQVLMVFMEVFRSGPRVMDLPISNM